MNMATKQDIIERYIKEYLKASKARKSEILTYVVDVTELNRKSVIRSFRRQQLRRRDNPPAKRGRRMYYTPDVTAALKEVWYAANEPCGELLHPLICEYVAIFKRDNQWNHSDEATGKLLAMKEHTVRRRVSGFTHVLRKKGGLSTTKPSHLKSIIPVCKGPWKDFKPGYCQLDTVAHCDNSLSGDFVYTLNYTDTATYWVVPRAQWNKGAQTTVESMKAIKKRVPVVWYGAHPDTGSEFINWVAKSWCDKENIALTRSEPGKKNDNMYVEERNGHVVRKYLGYTRFDNEEVLPLINEFYDVLALYLNHFQTVRRTLSKTRVGAKYVRTFEKIPLTPYRRMLGHAEVPDEVKVKLQAFHDTLNPLVLKRELDRLITRIMKVQRSATELK